MYFIYEITTTDDLKYIGITNNLSKRLWDHKHRPHFKHEFKSYRILDQHIDPLNAYDLEWFYINMLLPELNKDQIGSPPPDRVFSFEYLKSEYDRVMNR